MPTISFSADLLERAFTLVRQGVKNGEFPSAVLAIADREQIIRCEAYGPADGSYAVSTDSIYLLASITKPIVATAIMRLVERGKILLHEPIAGLWPEFGVNHKETVTLWHLLTHTSGLDESYQTRQRGENASPTTLAPADLHTIDLAGAVGSFLNYRPGSRHTYCNASFRVMAGLIERLTGQSYVDFLRAEVLEPLGMVDTTFAPSAEQAPRAVPVADLPWPEEFFRRLATPAGGLYSTAADLIAFGRAFLNRGRHNGYRLLSPSAVAAMTRVQFEGTTEYSPGQVEPLRWGLGWSLNKGFELAPPPAFGHGGATGTYLLVDPVHDLVVVFLTNRWGQDSRPRDRIFNAIYGAIE